jgi:hypothetical protein
MHHCTHLSQLQTNWRGGCFLGKFLKPDGYLFLTEKLIMFLFSRWDVVRLAPHTLEKQTIAIAKYKTQHTN